MCSPIAVVQYGSTEVNVGYRPLGRDNIRRHRCEGLTTTKVIFQRKEASSAIVEKVLRRPILILFTLGIKPNQAVRQEVINNSLCPSLFPVQV